MGIWNDVNSQDEEALYNKKDSKRKLEAEFIIGQSPQYPCNSFEQTCQRANHGQEVVVNDADAEAVQFVVHADH